MKTNLSKKAAYLGAGAGLVLFAFYLVFYGAFIGLSAFASDLMHRRPFGGVNLAVLFGLGLIVLALVLAAVYTALCRSTATRTAADGRR